MQPTNQPTLFPRSWFPERLEGNFKTKFWEIKLVGWLVRCSFQKQNTKNATNQPTLFPRSWFPEMLEGISKTNCWKLNWFFGWLVSSPPPKNQPTKKQFNFQHLVFEISFQAFWEPIVGN